VCAQALQIRHCLVAGRAGLKNTLGQTSQGSNELAELHETRSHSISKRPDLVCSVIFEHQDRSAK
jgi:hypothetical protein